MHELAQIELQLMTQIVLTALLVDLLNQSYSSYNSHLDILKQTKKDYTVEIAVLTSKVL